MKFLCFSLLSLLTACTGGNSAEHLRNLFLDVVHVPAGQFWQGSSAQEKEYAYQLDEQAYGHSVTRKQRWYDGEPNKRQVYVEQFNITRTPITQAQYAKFIQATRHRAPFVSENVWKTYKLKHPYSGVQPYLWQGRKPPVGKENHPVVLVSHADAQAYARWLSAHTGKRWRLPTDIELEKALRGTDGRIFPWGNTYDGRKLNSHDTGPFATVPVGQFPAGNSPYGLQDAAGQVFEWTHTLRGNNKAFVKGGSWDDKGCGVCRPSARHTRPLHLKHILVGFRLVQEN